MLYWREGWSHWVQARDERKVERKGKGRDSAGRGGGLHQLMIHMAWLLRLYFGVRMKWESESGVDGRVMQASFWWLALLVWGICGECRKVGLGFCGSGWDVGGSLDGGRRCDSSGWLVTDLNFMLGFWRTDKIQVIALL